jgi:hypothetical protein
MWMSVLRVRLERHIGKGTEWFRCEPGESVSNTLHPVNEKNGPKARQMLSSSRSEAR